MTDISNINKKLLAANAKVLIAAGIDPNNPYLPMTDEAKDKAADKQEKHLQRECEAWLSLRGYAKRTPTWILAERPKRGWQFHLNKAQGNPMLLDILLLGNDGRYLEVELKQRKGRWSSDSQQALCTVHGYPCVRMFVDLVAKVEAWEQQEGK